MRLNSGSTRVVSHNYYNMLTVKTLSCIKYNRDAAVYIGNLATPVSRVYVSRMIFMVQNNIVDSIKQVSLFKIILIVIKG